MRIGELSTRTGVSVRALRHYDQAGLLSSRRRENGYRDFPESEVRRVLRIRSLLHHGFTVEEIRPLAACLDGPLDEESFCEDALELYESRLAELDARIAELQAQRRQVAERTDALRGMRARQQRTRVDRAVAAGRPVRAGLVTGRSRAS